MRDRLSHLLKTYAFEAREVTLSSGKKSNFYIDCKQVTLTAEGAYLIGQLLFHEIEQMDDIAAVGGLTLGADPLVTAVAYTSYLEAAPVASFIVRKQPKGHGTQAYLEGVKHIPAGSRVVILEDVITTGASALEAVKRSREHGFEVAKVLAVVDRDEGGREAIEAAGLTVFSLFKRGDFF
ncbi:MAG: Orotate phosphoribosyltransferase [Myxococcota bacterium]|nr:Orotate phosphoribosyltransferase [Myxococcota bacterium]